MFFFVNRIKAKGVDVGVVQEGLQDEVEQSSNEDTDEEDVDDNDIELIRAKKALKRELPLSFANMDAIKNKFEGGPSGLKEEKREERKQEIQNIRSRLFMGKQGKMKELYQQAVNESEKSKI